MNHLEPAREMLFLAIGVWIALALIKALIDLAVTKMPNSTAASTANAIFEYPFKIN